MKIKSNNAMAGFLAGKIFLSFFLIFLDQVLKLAVIKRLHQCESFPLIENIFHLTLVYNTGSAFGFFRNLNWLLTYISVFAIILIFLLLVRRPRFSSVFYLHIWQNALILVLSGASGNLIDRIRLGYVIDFLDLRIWPVFNFADMMITCGVFLLLFILVKKEAVIE
ncbi:MAG: signal peptidase II [Candidatus Omnitrophica bacterium]|nr:signal peptidase II [Candidatus Omnitrophota bacterium]